MLGYKENSVLDSSKLLSVYQSNQYFSKSVNTKALYQIVNITLALQDRIKNVWATEKIINGLVQIKEAGMKYLKKEEAPPEIENIKENKLTKQGTEVLKFIVQLIEPIQVAIRDNPKHPDKLSNKIVNFMKPSSAFFLSDKSKQSFMGRLDLENSRQNINSEITLFMTEMEFNKEFCQNNYVLYNITRNSSMVTLKVISWLLALDRKSVV